MTTEKVVRIFAGAVVLASLALGVQASPAFHSASWLWLTAFVGANLFQSGFTGFCPLEMILTRLGVKHAAA
jgi:NADH:ubiquinone oxidoreductase subunit 6 (subunit J)